MVAAKYVLNKQTQFGNNIIEGQTNGFKRWQLCVGDFGGEAAGNVGTDFSLFSFTDGGALTAPSVVDQAPKR